MTAPIATPSCERWPGLLIYACGAFAASLIFGFVLVGVVVEARESWRGGAAAFLADAALRVGFGACIAILGATPYLLLAKASRAAGPPVFFAAASVAMIGCQLGYFVHTMFFASSSTASIGLLFMPLYLLVPAIAIWTAAVLARRVRLNRGSQ